MSKSVTVIIIEKNGTLKPLNIKDYKEETLYKKCGFKKMEDFVQQTQWKVKLNGQKIVVILYGKSQGKAGNENKYDFPPPVDTTLFFGTCMLVGMIPDDKNRLAHINLTTSLWAQIYDKLFKGFEDLNEDDENEEDELESVPKKMKTKTGYLKDDFVVENSDEDLSDDTDSIKEYHEPKRVSTDDENSDSDVIDDDICSELSEESYI